MTGEKGSWIELTTASGVKLGAYVVKPQGEVRGALVVVQEIYGVNRHIQAVCDGYAKEGYAVVAPALFDRFEKDVDLNYGPEEMGKAFELYGKLTPETTLEDVAPAFAEAGKYAAKVGIVGFCYGGFTAWIAATRGAEYGMKPACAVGYYAGGIGKVAGEQPACPVLLHFGALDSHIGSEQIEAVRSAHPEGSEPPVAVYVYPGAKHAFNREPDPDAYSPSAAALAKERTMQFLAEYLG